MSEWIAESWRALTPSNAGLRFEQRYVKATLRQRSRMPQGLGLACGIAVLALGLIMVPAPAPGLPFILAGAGMIAEQSLRAARLFDKCELALLGAVARIASRNRSPRAAAH
jgi:hypothetical protein